MAVRGEAAAVGDEQEVRSRRGRQQNARRLAVGGVVVACYLRIVPPDHEIAIAGPAADQNDGEGGGRRREALARALQHQVVEGIQRDPSQESDRRQDAAAPQPVRHPFDRQEVRQEHHRHPGEKQEGDRSRCPASDQDETGEKQQTGDRVEHRRAAQIVPAVVVAVDVEHQERGLEIALQVGRYFAPRNLGAEDRQDASRVGEMLGMMQVVQQHRPGHDDRRRDEQAELPQRDAPGA